MAPNSHTANEVTGFLSPNHILVLPWKNKTLGELICPGSTLCLGTAACLFQGTNTTEGPPFEQFCAHMKFLLHAPAEDYTSTTRRCKVQAVLHRRPNAPEPVLHYPSYWTLSDWVLDAFVIFTDGSHSSSGPLDAHLQGTIKPKEGTVLVEHTNDGRYDALFLT